MKTRSSETQAEAEELDQSQSVLGNVHCDWFILPPLLATPSIWFSLDRISRVGGKWKRSDSSDSDSIALMTLLKTPIFDVH